MERPVCRTDLILGKQLDRILEPKRTATVFHECAEFSDPHGRPHSENEHRVFGPQICLKNRNVLWVVLGSERERVVVWRPYDVLLQRKRGGVHVCRFQEDHVISVNSSDRFYDFNIEHVNMRRI